MWIRNCWQVIAFSKEIGATPLARTICEEKVVLFRTGAGEAVALADRCPHRLAPLSLGRVVGDTIQCGYHGLCFDAQGQCVRVPGQDTVPRNARVRNYPLVERHTFAWIWLGDAARADPAAIPDVHWVDDPAWAAVTGYHHFGANYQLVNDNLLDLSHESFVHEETIGNESVAEAPCHVTLVGNTRARAPRHVQHRGAAVLQAHHRLHRPHQPLAHRQLHAAGPEHHRERLDAGRRQGQERGARAQGDQPDHAGDEDDLALLLGDRAPVRAQRPGALRLHLRGHLQDLRPGQGDPGGAAARDRRDPDRVSFPVSIRVDAGPIQGRKLVAAMLEREAAEGKPLASARG